MNRRPIASAVGPFILAALGGSTWAGEPLVEYFKKGEVGAFVATIPLSEGIDRATTIFSLQSTNDSIYLLFVESPQDLHEQAALLPKHERMLAPVDRAKLDELTRQSHEFDRSRSELITKMYTDRGRLQALTTLLAEEEAKGEAGDGALIAQTRKRMEDLETDVRNNDAEFKQIEQMHLEVQSEIWKTRDGASERLPEESGQRPEDQARTDALNKEQFELIQATGPIRAKNNANYQRLKGLESLLAEEEAKGPSANPSFIARTRESIKSLEAPIREGAAEDQQLQKRLAEIQQELRRIRTGASQRLPRAAAESPVKVYGRFQGAGNPTLTVLGRGSEALLAQPQPVGTVQLHLPATDGGDEALLTAWARARARYFGRYVLESPFSSFYQFCLLQSGALYGLPQNELPGTLRQSGRPWGRGMPTDRQADLYSMTTGALAIQESLQLDAMTGRRTVPDDRSVPLGVLDGPEIRSHPFGEMLEGRAPAISPIASLVPHDAYYCGFASISKEIEASDLLEQWGTSLLRTLTVSARDSDLPSRYQEQLCIGVSSLTRLFGDLVIGEIVLTGSDPFLKEGTDLTVIIQVKNRPVFDRQMGAYLEEALTKNPDAKSVTVAHEGVEILSVTTSDRRIASHSAYVGGHKAYSNSLDVMKRIIDTHARRRPSMADNPDFRYMRTIFPSGSGDDGFLYFSDAFIRKLVGPRWKVEAQRRIICQSHLRMITNAATMYRTELRKEPDVATLLRERYLPTEALRCPDGGAYSLNSSGNAACSVHNRLRYCAPVDSVAVTHVSKEEAEEYKAFVANYNRYWRQYFDPIGIRFRAGNHVEVETCILPLVENTIYSQLRELAVANP